MTDTTPPSPNHGPALTVIAQGSGRVVIASDALLSQLDQLGRLAEELRLCAGALLATIELLEPRASIASAVPPAAIEGRRVSRAAATTLLAAQSTAERIEAAVRSSLAEYAETEQLASSVAHRLANDLAWGIGAGAHVFGLPFALLLGSGLLVGSALTRQSPSVIGSAMQDYLKRHGRILTSSGSVSVIRELASDADGIGAGFLLVPPQAASLFDSSGVTGVSSSSNAVVAAGRSIGLFEPTSAGVRKTSGFEYGSPPTSLVARSSSFPRPDADPNGEQIRIDRYVEAGKPDRFDVYIAGTVTFDPKTGSEPFDFASDLNGVGGGASASYQAVIEAMKQAGVTPDSPVVLNGYSQGGLLASQVAASGQFNVHGVVTFGAPSAQVHIPASIPVLTVRNAEDLVPATSGYDVNPNAVVVERPVFAGGPVPSDSTVPAHDLGYYQQTAAVVDESTSSTVRGVLDPLNRFGSGAERVDSTLWLATRTAAVSGGR